MKRRFFLILLALEAILCVTFCLFRDLTPHVVSTLTAFPLEQIAYTLRLLSLSGSIGNIAAIILYVVISLLPLLALLKKQRHWEDWFAVLLSFQLFLSLYCMINPGLISQKLILPLGEQAEKAMLGGMFYSLLVSHLVLKLVRSFFATNQPGLIRYLQILLYGLCALLVYLVFAEELSALMNAIDALKTSNKGNEHLLGTSYVFLFLQYLLVVIPYLLDIAIVFYIKNLLHAEPHSEHAVTAVEQLSKFCRFSLVLMVVSHTVYQIAQLLFLKNIHQSSVTVSLPLFSLLFVLTVLLASQYIKENKALKDDNDMFI